MIKITNVTVENMMDREWKLVFHFGDQCDEIWFHNDMSIETVLRALIRFSGKIFDRYTGIV